MDCFISMVTRCQFISWFLEQLHLILVTQTVKNNGALVLNSLHPVSYPCWLQCFYERRENDCDHTGLPGFQCVNIAISQQLLSFHGYLDVALWPVLLIGFHWLLDINTVTFHCQVSMDNELQYMAQCVLRSVYGYKIYNYSYWFMTHCASVMSGSCHRLFCYCWQFSVTILNWMLMNRSSLFLVSLNFDIGPELLDSIRH